jgi:hypothetical protein
VMITGHYRVQEYSIQAITKAKTGDVSIAPASTRHRGTDRPNKIVYG